jgi:hypothetical protein
MENKDDPSKKIPKKKKPIIKKETKSPVKKDPMSLNSEQIKNLLRDALIKNFDEKTKQSDLEIDSLISTMEEFLRSFIVIGYTMDNEPIAITNAKSQLDADALYTALGRMFFTINGNGSL